jgi:hypothetical protein
LEQQNASRSGETNEMTIEVESAKQDPRIISIVRLRTVMLHHMRGTATGIAESFPKKPIILMSDID